jgi:isopenicillin N synthase-like dioxygenase
MNIPVIDVAPYLHGREKQDVARQIGQACIEIGFFTIRGHGIPLAMIQQTNEAAHIFFDGAVADKRRFQQPGGMGYIGSDGENLAASLDDKQVQDVKESLNLTLPIDKAIWPSFPPQLRLLGQRYYTAVLQLSHHLMRLFALALGLPENWFDDKVNQPRTILRLLNYPPIPGAATSQTRAGAHTDYGTLTILWSPDSRGLQVQTRSGNWIDVVAPADHFIINIGDLMMNWTNDRWRSTLHRVVPHPDTVGQRRQSMAFFHNPNPDALIECIATCTDAHNPPQYAPILAKTHLEKKIAKSLGQSIKL